jgi:four helix bundle protein
MYYGYYRMEQANKQTNFHSQLRSKLDAYVHKVYDVTLRFPREEQFGVTSQLRRATLSIMLNYIEGFARKRKLVLKQFLKTSYGSLKESKYLLLFPIKELI